MRPGGPQAFGVVGGTVFYGLPGNPVSSAVVFDQLARPLLRTAMGVETPEREVRRARLLEAVPSKTGRRDFVRLRLEESDGRLAARLTGTQSSGAVTSLTKADALGVVPEDVGRLEAGSEIEVVPWRENG
jgi:molybdopterin molybdotransferase